YPTLKFLVRFGNVLAVVLGIAPIALAWALGASPVILVIAVLAGVVLGFFVRSYVELVRVVIDMLLPQ
ncbi:MAG: hypothetical protein HQ503_01710, partial [Rhodospirillales bacterium]|nr:hypothetical protein [Rhodospirillales bacterium]